MTYDVAVVGGGIVGLAVTRELSLRFPALRIANVEKEAAHALHQSGRNSGVVHSGIYYRPGSMRAALCIEGRRSLERYCAERGVPYKRTGKLIVAVDAGEFERLDDLWNRGRANGVEGIELLDERGIAEREPHCRGLRAIWSPATGAVDFQAVARAFADDARERGAEFFFDRHVTAIRRRGDTSVLESSLGALEARWVLTCAGLYADRVARASGGAWEPALVPFRGDFMELAPHGRHLVRGNIYPVPDPAFPFLGVHLTTRIDDSVWLGPTAVLALAREAYSPWEINARDVAETVAEPGFRALVRRHWRTAVGEYARELLPRTFIAALQRYVPDLRAEDCVPGPSGVRAQAILPDGGLLDDFALEHAPGALHVRNAPSPAATSALAIARFVADEADRRLGSHRSPQLRKERIGMDTFIEASWLLAHAGDPRVRIVDTRSTPHGAPGAVTVSGADQYAAGHIPGAVYLDYADHLADPATPHATRVAPAELFAQTLGNAGIGDGDTIVAYDEGTTPYAARFVWMCRYYGHDDVHVLAGGLPAWIAAGGAVTADAPSPEHRTFTVRERPKLRASLDEVLAVATGQGDAQLLETQRDATYATRDRDIAGARRLSGSLLLEDARGGRIADRSVIDKLVSDLALDRTKRTIVSCGSGVSASGAYLALSENGFTDVAVYDGSWMEWSHHGLPTVPKP